MEFSIYLSVYDFYFNSTVVLQHTLYSFYFLNLLRFCFIAKLQSVLVNVLCELMKNVSFCCC